MEELARNDLQTRLSELRGKLQTFPYKKRELMKQFNDELAFGSSEKAEQHRTEISRLEKEGQALSSEIKKIELLLEEHDQEQS